MTAAVSFLLALVMPCLDACVRRNAEPFILRSLRDEVTTGARHLAHPPLVPLLPEPLLWTTATVVLAADDVDEGDGTEVMLVLGMPGMFMCVGTPLLTILLELLGKIRSGRGITLIVCKIILSRVDYPKLAGAVMCVCCGTGTVGNRDRVSVAVDGVVTTAVCTSPDTDETTAPPPPPFC